MKENTGRKKQIERCEENKTVAWRYRKKANRDIKRDERKRQR